MLFPTLGFLLFFLIVAAAMAVLGTRFAAKKTVLVVASYYFYAQWDWRFCFLLAGSSILSYLAGWLIDAAPDRRRQIILGIAVALHLAGRLPATVDQATFLACVAAFALGAALVLSGEEPDWGREDADETPPWWPAFEEEFRAYEASGRSTKVRA